MRPRRGNRKLIARMMRSLANRPRPLVCGRIWLRKGEQPEWLPAKRLRGTASCAERRVTVIGRARFAADDRVTDASSYRLAALGNGARHPDQETSHASITGRCSEPGKLEKRRAHRDWAQSYRPAWVTRDAHSSTAVVSASEPER